MNEPKLKTRERRLMTPEEEKSIEELYALGLTYQQIGNQIGRPAGTVGTVIKRQQEAKKPKYFNVDQYENWLI